MGFRQIDERERFGTRRVYLDYAATAPFDERLRPAFVGASWANASALYAEGREAASQVEDARRRIALALGAHAPAEIVFTSGGTESANTAVRGMCAKVPGAAKTHVVVSAIEHHAVLHAADALKAQGFKVTSVPCSRNGIVEPQALEAVLAKIEAAGDAASVVAVQAVNNEIGSIQPVRDLVQVAHNYGALFFCDAVQALGRVEIDLEGSGVDAAGFSAHKVGGLKGSGFLYLRRGVKCRPLVFGGGQEGGKRSGTTNTPGAVVCAAAVELAVDERDANWRHALEMRDRLLEGVAAGSYPHGLKPTLSPDASAVPHIVSFIADGLEGETMVMRLDTEGISASAGSACSSGSLDPSHVLLAAGIDRDAAYGSLRVSFGPRSGLADVDTLLAVLPKVLR